MFKVGDRVKTIYNKIGIIIRIDGNIIYVRCEDNLEYGFFSDILEIVEDTKLHLDEVNQPKHYVSHPCGVECIQVVEHMNFCLGNAIKYIWRAGLKTEDQIKDLKKARWYIDREISRIEK